MFRNILVALDRSPSSQAALAQAMTLAGLGDSQILLLHVLTDSEEGAPEPPMLVTSGDYFSDLNKKLQQDYQRQWVEFVDHYQSLLQQHVDAAASAGIPSRSLQIPGPPGRTICEVAQSQGVDLILIGSRGQSGLREMMLGSVSNYVTHHAPCSVLVVPPVPVDLAYRSQSSTIASAAGVH